MSKVFNNIQELWDYCSCCPICQQERKIEVSVGPDDYFRLFGFTKQKSSLELRCQFRKKRDILYKIDCNTNSFDVNTIKHISNALIPPNNLEEANFYFYIQSWCLQCDCSSVFSDDLELDFLNKKVFNIGLERENFHIDLNKWRICLYYKKNIMQVVRYNAVHSYLETISLPLVKLDWSNQLNIINKIKILILFS